MSQLVARGACGSPCLICTCDLYVIYYVRSYGQMAWYVLEVDSHAHLTKSLPPRPRHEAYSEDSRAYGRFVYIIFGVPENNEN